MILKAKRKVIFQYLCSSEHQKPLTEIELFSSFLKEIEIVGRIKKFVFNIRSQIKREIASLSPAKFIKVEELLIKEVEKNIRKKGSFWKKEILLRKPREFIHYAYIWIKIKFY